MKNLQGLIPEHRRKKDGDAYEAFEVDIYRHERFNGPAYTYAVHLLTTNLPESRDFDTPEECIAGALEFLAAAEAGDLSYVMATWDHDHDDIGHLRYKIVTDDYVPDEMNELLVLITNADHSIVFMCLLYKPEEADYAIRMMVGEDAARAKIILNF